MNSRQLRARLVVELVAAGDVRSDAVRRAFLAVPRERFVPDVRAAEGLERVYRNDAIVTKWDGGMPTSSSSQPSIMAHMVEALSVAPGHRVLEIGLGTGYNAALLRTLVGRTGRVSSIDQDADCVREATDRLDGYDVETVLGDGYDGVASAAPYDRIIVTASVTSCPQAWWHQLVPGGLLVVPLRFTDQMEAQAVVVLARTADGFDSVGIIPGGFMALRRRDEPAHAASPVLSAYDHTTSPPRVLMQLSGPAIGRTAPPARARLLSTALTRASSRTWTGAGLAGAPWHLQLAVPRSRLVVAMGEQLSYGATGLTDTGRTGLALITVPWGVRHGAARGLAWGNPRCAQELADHMSAWRRAGRPRIDRLKVAVRYNSTDPVRLPRPVKTIEFPDQTLHVGWGSGDNSCAQP